MQFFIRQLLKTVGVFTRSIRAVVTRHISGVTTRIRKLTNISQQATHAATAAVQSATEVAKTPSKREDYVAFGNLLIAKSFLARLAIGLCLLGMLGYYIAWPFILSHFLTARFWVEDKRVPTWTGRVIVFTDKKKTIPVFSGKLQEGKLQGDGKEYADGVLAYEGGFLDGVRSGTGKAYEGGELSYEGQFSQGIYEGTGISYVEGQKEYEGQFSAGKYHGRGTLYQDNSLLYDGQFDHGLYEGQGSLYQAGVLSYEGAFREGTPQGIGTAYYYSGGVRYQGQFENGVPEGTGRAYEDGRLIYQGSFSKGQYSGNGILYPSEGEQLEAEFSEGTPQGVVKWSKGGKLYYEGEWSDNRPAGYGILYAKSGDAAYRGAFSQGTIDGSSLLGLSADEVRRALGEENTKNTAGAGSTFSISSPQLGMTVQCTYQTASAPSQATAVYLYSPQDGESWFRLLPGLERAAPIPEDAWRGMSYYNRQDAVPLASGQYDSAAARLNGGAETVFYQRQAPVLVRWTGSGSGSEGGIGTAVSASNPDSAVDAALDALAGGITGMDSVEELLAALDEMASIPASTPVEFGDAPVGDALAGCADMDAASDMLSAMSDYWYQAEKENLLKENLVRTNALLEDAKQAAAMGQGSADAVAALEDAKHSLEAQILDCELELKQAETTAQAAAGGGGAAPLDLVGMDLAEVSTLFNPSGINPSELPLVAAAYAQAKGEEIDPAALELRVKSSLLTLQKSYEASQAAIKEYEAAVQAADKAAKDYAMGTGSKADWYNALSAKNDTRASLYANMNGFTKQSAELNSVTGGWVSRSMDWHADAFAAVSAAQFPEGIPPLTEASGGGQSGGETTSGGGQSGSETTSGGGQSGSETTSGGGQSNGETTSGGGQTTDAGMVVENSGATDTQKSGNIYADQYPEWYDETVEPVENEPGLPLETQTNSSDGKTGSMGGEASGSASEVNTSGSGTSASGGETSGSVNGTSASGSETSASAGEADTGNAGESSYPNGMTAEEWDALWGAPPAA